MTSCIIKRIPLYFILAFFLVAHGSANAQPDDVKDFVQNLASDVLTITSDEKIPEKEKEEKLQKIFYKNVDTKWIARFVMGRYWNSATAEQKEKYVKLYSRFLMNSYVPKFREYNDQQVTIGNATKDGDGNYMVESIIGSQNHQPVKVDYKIRNNNNHYMIYDIVAEGVSMITTQRSEFASVLSRNGIDSLIGMLEARVNGGKNN